MTLGLFLSGNIMVFDFLHFEFFPSAICTLLLQALRIERLCRNFYIFFLWKSLTENKEVGTICFEVRIPMKKTKTVMEFFYVNFQK